MLAWEVSFSLMSMKKKIDGENTTVVKFTIFNEITKSDFSLIRKRIEKYIEKSEKINLLIELKDFKGWEKSVDWSDNAFVFGHENEIGKVAIIGEPEWKEMVMVFIGEPFVETEIRYFCYEEIEQANNWIKSKH